MTRVAVRGLVDFRESSILDMKWWRYYFVVLDAMLREDDARLIEAQRSHHLALISNANLTDDGFERHQKLASDCMWKLVSCFRPWEITDQAERKKQEYSKLKSAWEEMFGKMDDPETQRNIALEVERMKENAAKAAAYIDEEVVVQDRLMDFWAKQREEQRLAREKVSR